MRLPCVLLAAALLGCSTSAAAAPPPGTSKKPGPPPTGNFPAPGDATYDYVIVGGGTAGLAMAARLAEAKKWSVAVIEAGGFYEQDNGNLSVVPGYCTVFAGTDPAPNNPLVDWGFQTTPQAGAGQRQLHYARGKTLGGSSARNFMLYHRQTVGSAQMWADQVGDQSYSFSNLLPYYEKSVHYTPPSFPQPNSSNTQDSTTLNSGGAPLEVSFGGYNDPFGTYVQPAMKSIGQALINGFQSGRLLGTAYAPSTIDPKKATRSSSETSFLQSALGVTTLQVYKNTLAQKILFDKHNTATGVAVTTGTTDYVLTAKKEVILSAGTFQSPQLLMVSGIGPKETLQKLGIPIVKELPGVGQNMWDHAFYGTSFRVNMLTNSAGLNNPALAAAAIAAYQQAAAGPLSVASTGVLGWEKLPSEYRAKLSGKTQKDLSAFPADWPEIEFLVASGFYGNGGNVPAADPKDGYNYATVATALVAPLSRGSVSISSAKMSDAPVIDPNWLTDPADVDLAVAAFKRQRQAWAGFGNLTIGGEYYPGGSVQTDEQILGFIRANAGPVWHASSTCKMGKAADAMAVVDSGARVFGVGQLRVVDASAFPFLPPGHPQATVYALAEKIADEILSGKKNGDW